MITMFWRYLRRDLKVLVCTAENSVSAPN